MWSKKLICHFHSRQNVQVYRLLWTNSKSLQKNQLQEKENPSNVKEYLETPPPAKDRTLKKFKEPFPKCFFAGKCDPEVLEYPEVLNLQEIDKINQMADEIQAVVEHEINPQWKNEPLSKDMVKKISDMKLCGIKLPLQYHGLGLTETEAAVMSEAVALNPNIYKFVAEQHNLAGKILSRHGSDLQKNRYLSSMILGKSIVSCAYQEKSTMSDSVQETFALAEADGSYSITGSKTWVYNANEAEAFIVFAGTVMKDDTGQRKPALTAFIVPANTPGLTIEPPLSKIALHGINACQVNFQDVKVGADSIVGELYGGDKIIMSTMGEKFDLGPLVVGVGKNLLEHIARHAINTNFMGKPMAEMDGVQYRIGAMAAELYRLESAIYLQKGHADLYENPDSFLELCILKVLANNTLDYLVKESFQLLGSEAVANKEFAFLADLVKESAYFSACDETTRNIKTAIALNGCQHAGLSVHEEIHKRRNPLMFPAFIMKKLIEGKKRYGGDRGKDLGLSGYLHPSLEAQAHTLEFCISRVFWCTETLLSNYGLEVMEKHTMLGNLADLAIETYALTAAIGRASRSYCIGLAEANIEMDLATAIARSAEQEVRRLTDVIQYGDVENNSKSYELVSQRLLFNKGYAIERPIARNF